MSGVNKAIILGNLGRDPETRYSKDGKPITSFSVATSQKWGDQEKTEWHNVVCFGRLAEISGEYLRKGSKVYVEGSLSTSSWEKDGQKHYKTEIIAQVMQMIGSPANAASDSGGFESKAIGRHGSDRNAPESSAEPFNDDIPFSPNERGWLV